MSREELEKKAWKQFDVHSTLTKKVDILVCEDVDSGTEKVEKAKRYGTKIMNYYDFLELLDGGDRAQSKKELREYMAEKKLSDASKYRLKISNLLKLRLEEQRVSGKKSLKTRSGTIAFLRKWCIAQTAMQS